MSEAARNFVVALVLGAGAWLAYGADPEGSLAGPDRKAMDLTVNPCQNFYQYACGTWRKDNPIPPDRARWSRFDELHEHNLATERDILTAAAKGGANRSAVDQEIGDFYAACMDEKTIEARGVTPIAETLKQIDAIALMDELRNEIARLHRSGVRVLFGFGVRPDPKNASMQIANVGQGGLTLPDRDYYLKTDAKSVALREQFQQHVRAMFDLLAHAQGGGNVDAGAAAQDVLAIETALAKASMDRVSMRNPDNTYHKLTVKELDALDPDFGWDRYLATQGAGSVQTLNVSQPEFLKALEPEMQAANLPRLKTYLKWHVLNADAEMLPLAFQQEDFKFSSHILRGTQEMSARWKRCVGQTDRALGEALGEKFVQVAFSGPSKAKALQLVGEIEAEMKNDIRTASWMTPATRDQAMTKLNAVSNKIGYPEKWRDYSSVKIARDDYFGDAVRAREFEINRNLAKLGKPVDKSEWTMTPPTVNAYYSPPMNNINFPAGILQPPFYNPKADDAVNYGAIAVVIGHELTHGFDDQGRRYDGQGNLRDWWTTDDAKAFQTRADCISNEYGGFSPVEGVKLNGKLTLGENAADNGGIHLAYMALMDHLANKTLPPKHDGFTPQQEMFLGFAQIWCENSTEQSSRLSATTDPHSPGEFRVNGVVQNLPEFQQAFSCKVGDAMVSPQACRVW